MTHEQKRIKKIPTYFLKILTCSIIRCLQIPKRLDYTYFLVHHRLLPLSRERKKTSIERRQLFTTAEKVRSLSSTQRESSSSQNRKAGHTHRTTTIPSLLAYGGEGNKTSITTMMYYNTYQFFPYSFINIK